ncbi:LAGLIDADG family homing endonuclease [candidate division KSB1 bacterium]
MGRKWTKKEEGERRGELEGLYVTQNKSIREIGAILSISEKTVFQRMKRLGIKSEPYKKVGYLNKRKDLIIPLHRNGDLAEFFGIMLGDGHISSFQIVVTLGSMEIEYARYVVSLMHKIFNIEPKIGVRKTKHYDVYFGSVELVKWLRQEGLVSNKVVSQVDVPQWVFEKPVYMKRFLRGFFDTDGSIYRLRHGIQIELSNRSKPLLGSLQKMLRSLQYTPSNESCFKVYVTKRREVSRFFKDIQPQNKKHLRRYKEFVKCVGT